MSTRDETGAEITKNSPVISLLHHDLLWQIFMIVADMAEDNEQSCAFYNIFQASHVCCSWRNLTLASPSIWARIVDLTILSKAHDALRKEVLQRTGTSPLSIKGKVDESSSSRIDVHSAVGFFFSLLRDEWARIRHLDVILHSTILNSLIGDYAGLLSRPAPVLNTFKLQLPYNARYYLQHGLSENLFSNNAPFLTAFAFPSAPPAASATWLQTLLSLDVVANPEVIDALEKAPNLEALCLDERRQLVFSAPNTAPFAPHDRRIPLRNLGLIQLKEVSESSLRVIDQVIPAPNCALELSSVNFEFLPPPNPRSTIIKTLLTRFANITDSTITFISFDYGQTSFSVTTRSIGQDHRSAVLGRSTKVFLSENTFTFLLNTISLGPLDRVTTLHMTVNGVTLYMLKSSLINPTYRSFFSAFRSLETIRVNPDLLNFLLLLFKPGQVFFQFLKTIEVVDSNEWSHKDFVLAFLQRHRESGGQIATLDLTRCINPVFKDYSFREQVKMLDVTVLEPPVGLSVKTYRRVV